ncbi:MAG TPA: sensor domain-containing diguanylate cyclase [Stellaceae bacterium]|jgi:diguanylate cyclase (GGDEF)-like protein|nr:sensor domain-containing diguanylate cyclase [Stellaceae bacterium]
MNWFPHGSARRIRFRFSMRLLTIGFVVIVCTIPSIVDGIRVWQDRDREIAASARETGNLARALGEDAEDVFRVSDGFLMGLRERVEHDGTGPAKLVRLHNFMTSRLPTLQGVRSLAVLDAKGNVIVGTASNWTGLNLADSVYFRFHRDHPDRTTHYNHPISDPMGGEWLIPLTRRLNNPDGSFAGVAVAALDMDYFDRFFQTFSIGQHGSIFLALDDGTLLARRPFDPSLIGSDVTKGSVFNAIRKANPIGSIETRAPSDGIVRMNSYRLLTEYPLVVSVALQKDEILEPWLGRTWSDFSGDIGLAAGLGVFGLLLVRQMGFRGQAQKATEAAKRELEDAYRRLEVIAQEDALTGLGNRRRFDEMLDNEFSRATRSGTCLSLILIDIDYFKRFNDRYGHPAGDECLRAVARAVKGALRRPGDLAMRYGGEELAILLPDTPEQGALAVAAGIRDAVRGLGLAHEDSPKQIVTLSLGVASLTPTRDQHVARDLVKAADELLYAAKANGRDVVYPLAETPRRVAAAPRLRVV